MRLALPDRVVDLELHRVEQGDERTPLSRQEVRLLAALVGAAGHPLGREQLLTEVWDFPEAVPTRAVDNAVYRLRHKLEVDPRAPRLLRTVRGAGYRWMGPGVEEGGHLHGRAEVLARILDTARPGQPLWLCGVPGVGKSEVARAWARRVQALWLSLRGVPPGGAAAALARTLSITLGPVGEAGAVRLLARALAGRGVEALVLDGGEVDLSLCRGLADAFEGAVLLTSTVAPEGVESLGLGPLDLPEASRLFADLASVDRAVARRIAERLEGLPLALEVVSGWSRQVPMAEIDAMLGAGVQPLAAVMELAWSHLGGALRRALAGLALLDRASFSRLHGLLGGDASEVGAAFRQLHESGFLKEGELLDAVRRFAAGRPEGLLLARRPWLVEQGSAFEQLRAAERLAAEEPVAARRLWLRVSRAALVVGPSPAPWLGRVRESLERAPDPEGAAEAGLLEAAVVALRGDHRAAIDRLEALLAGPGLDRERRLEARLRRVWSEGLAGTPDAARSALLALAEEAAQAPALPRIEAMALVRGASLAARLGRIDEAGRALERAVALHEAAGEAVAAARCRASLALIRLSRGDYDAAREQLRATVAVEREVGARAALAQHLLNLGGLELRAGRPEAAGEHLAEACDLAAEVGDRETLVLARLSSGAARLVAGALPAAVEQWTRARSAAREGPLTGVCWAYLGIAAARRGDGRGLEEARTHLLADTQAPEGEALRGILDALARGERAQALALARAGPGPFVATAALMLATAAAG